MSKSLSARQAALKALETAEDGDVELVVPTGLPPRERALFLELTQGVIRRCVTLDAVLEAYVSQGMKRTPARARHLLRLALYQLLFLDRIPDHAAVDEAVRAAGGRKARGFMNGVLRAILRGAKRGEADAEASESRLVLEDRSWSFDRRCLPDPAASPAAALATRLGFDRAAWSRLVDELGEDAACELAELANQRPEWTMRPRHGRETAETLAAKLREQDREVEIQEGHEAGVVRVTPLGDPRELPVFREGGCVVQGNFAARVVPLLSPRPGELLVDLCAAPGGKAIQAAEILEPEGGRVLACVLDEAGARRVRENRERLGVENLDLRRYSGGTALLADLDAGAVLLDVPCSNTGVLSRRPAARHRLDADSLRSLRTIQTELLRGALKAGSRKKAPFRVVYSTCSVLPSENETLVRETLADCGGAYRLVREIREFPKAPYEDGGYAALLEIEA